MRKLCWLLIIVLLVISFIACNAAQDKTDAEAVMMEYFETIKAGDYIAALDYYSPEFFGEISELEMLRILEGINEKMGDLEGYALKDFNISTMNMIGGPDKGKIIVRCQLIYDTTYSIHTATETYLLVRENEDRFGIVRFDLDSLDMFK